MLLSLLLKLGLAEQTAKAALKVAAVAAILAACAGLYRFIWAGPQATIAAQATRITELQAEVTQLETSKADWETKAGACTVSLDAFQDRCSVEVPQAAAAASAAVREAQSRSRAILADPARGPGAMNQFFAEIYP